MSLPESLEIKTKAHVWPFALFMILLVLLEIVGGSLLWEHPEAPWWRQSPQLIFFPLQILVCGGFLLRHWAHYDFAWSLKTLWGIPFGIVGIGIWMLPTFAYDWMGYTAAEQVPNWLAKLGVDPLTEGFNPGKIFGEGTAAYYAALGMRFVRAAVLVALVEEIFWRGFLMRYLLKPDGNYWKIPFGQAQLKTYLIVTLAFALVHPPSFWGVALIYGSLAYALTCWQKQLGAVVLMHATANAVMGAAAVIYGKFGLW